jgi:hypothetical protein
MEPDGLSLDFIRFFAYWEMIHPDRSYVSIPDTCYCWNCLERFSRDTGITVPSTIRTPEQAAAWIAAHEVEKWTDWKCRLIASMVQDIVGRVRKVRPGIRVNVHTVPWRQEDFGGALRKIVAQDVTAISQVTDYISPMCYSAMLQREPAWISSVVRDIGERTSCPIIPSIQVKESYPGDKRLNAADFEACLRAALQPLQRAWCYGHGT